MTKVLIVDDNDTNRRILGLQAVSWGMEPRLTGSPAEALAWVRGDRDRRRGSDGAVIGGVKGRKRHREHLRRAGTEDRPCRRRVTEDAHRRPAAKRASRFPGASVT